MHQINRRDVRWKLEHLYRIKSVALYISSYFRGESIYMTLTREGITYKSWLTQESLSNNLPYQRGPNSIHNTVNVSKSIAKNEMLMGKLCRESLLTLVITHFRCFKSSARNRKEIRRLN